MYKPTVENPKRYVAKSKGNAGWVDYYAGFCPHFAKTLLETSNLTPQAVIADPWNGSGTTVEAASVLGFKGYGFDINPAMLVVAKARMLRKPTKPSIKPLMRQIMDSAKLQDPTAADLDTLGLWFKPSGVYSIRRLEAALQQLLVDPSDHQMLRDRNIEEDVSDIAAFFYNALFRAVRRSIRRFHSSNPTWIRTAREPKDRISLGLTAITNEFRHQVNGMLSALKDVSFCHLDPTFSLKAASSTALPLNDESVDLILSSPPYCTRIDYAVTTLPELAVLGYSKEDIRSLRQTMIGTSTIAKKQPTIDDSWGATCKRFLRKVETHSSKASATYYHKNHLQYFAGMADSLKECNRVLKKGGRCVLVVQDSYYKDIHNNLARIVTQMAESRGFRQNKQVDFKQVRTLAGVNPGSRAYRDIFTATESVLFFSKD
jgi:tRNA G10  N-methylase Trm11